MVSCETVVADPSTVKGALIVEGAISSSNEIRVAYDEAGGGNCSVGSLGVKSINALNVYSSGVRSNVIMTRGLDAPAGSRAITMSGKMRVRGEIKTGVAKANTAMFLQEQQQWGLVQDHHFGEHDHGYKNGEVTECGVKMYGGHCKTSKQEIVKTVSDLPAHKKIRVVANYHFIDSWEGETGFAKINDQIVWADTHDAEGAKGLSMCGRKDVAEGKFASKIDVTIPHTESFLKLSFGATLDEHACDESYAVSGVQIFVQ